MDEHNHSENAEDTETMPRAVRWGWVAWCCLALSWYFYGYLSSLEAWLEPLYRRLPFLEQLLGKGLP